MQSDQFASGSYFISFYFVLFYFSNLGQESFLCMFCLKERRKTNTDLMVPCSPILLFLMFDPNQAGIDSQIRLYDGREILDPRNLRRPQTLLRIVKVISVCYYKSLFIYVYFILNIVHYLKCYQSVVEAILKISSRTGFCMWSPELRASRGRTLSASTLLLLGAVHSG